MVGQCLGHETTYLTSGGQAGRPGAARPSVDLAGLGRAAAARPVRRQIYDVLMLNRSTGSEIARYTGNQTINQSSDQAGGCESGGQPTGRS